MAKFVVSYINPKNNGNEEHEIVEAVDKEEALKVIKKKLKGIDISITNSNVYRGTKPAFNEGKR